VVLHKAITDDYSMWIVLDEPSTAYAAALDGVGAPAGLGELPAQYADCARRHLDWEATPAFRRQRDWWTTALQPAPPSLALPVDRARSPGSSSRSEVLRFDWGERVGGDLAGLCRAEGTTSSVALLAAFQVSLWRYSGEDRVAVGRPASVRPHADLERVVGPCVNLLVMCGDLSGSPTLRQAVGRTARTMRDALEHHEFPFNEVVRILNVDRDPSRIPLCQAMFGYSDGPEPRLQLAGAAVRPVPVDSGAAWADLVLSVERSRPSVVGSLAYRCDLFDAE
jgi:hypothetical protein